MRLPELIQRQLDGQENRFGQLAIMLLVIGGVLNGFSLDRYPGYYVDDAFFAFPAWKAAHGGSFTYAVSAKAPFANDIWAYHGPILPHLQMLLFRIFGFSSALSRLPDFLGGWTAALLMVLFLNRRGYRYAGLALAVLWCGDRAPQELMYGRMDGLALLGLVVSWFALRLACSRKSVPYALLTGLLCGLATLTHPLCVFFAAVSLALIFYWAQWRAAITFVVGGLCNLPLLLLLWNFQVRKSIAQFLWHSRVPRGDTPLHTFLLMLPVLRWSEYWFVTLLIFCAVCACIAGTVVFRRGRRMDERWLEFTLAACFAVASLQTFFRTATHPYYIVYFSLWAMTCFVMLTERFWKQLRYIAVAMSMVWCVSAAWNGMRLRESIFYHSELSKQFLYAELRKDVPKGAQLDATPELYSVPIEAGLPRYGLTTSFPEQQNICPACYLLITAREFESPVFISPANLHQREVVYAGPAFPGAGPLEYPIVVLAPEVIPTVDASANATPTANEFGPPHPTLGQQMRAPL